MDEVKEALKRYREIKSQSTAVADMNSEQMLASMFELKHITDKFPVWLASQQTLIDQQVQQVELLKQSKADVERNRNILSGELQLVVKALEWYADENNYEMIETPTDEHSSETTSATWTDNGEKARQTLKQIGWS